MNRDQKRAENLLAHLQGHKETLEGSPRISNTLAAGCKRGKRPFPGTEGKVVVKQPEVPIHHPYDGKE
jgi:hypothetical protein